MGIITNATNMDNIVYNGTAIEKVIYNGTIVWTKAPKVWDFSKYEYGEFVGLYGINCFLFSKRNGQTINVIDINTSSLVDSFTSEDLVGYCSDFIAWGNGVFCNMDRSGTYYASYLMNLQIEYRSQNKSIYSKMIGVDAANTIEQNFMMIGNLDFDTLELRLYGINYSENKLLLLVYGNYSTNESSGEDEWTNDYSDDFLIEVPIIKDGFLNYEDAHVIKNINHKCYTIDEPSSYEDFNLTYYYNPYTKDFYSVYYHEDFEGDISYSSSDTEWSGYTAKYMYHYIISHAQFSLIDVDATISIHDFSTRDNNFTIYVFNKKKIVKNVLTDEDFFGTLNNSSSQITIEYNGRDIYIINITKNLIRKLNFDTKTFKITL